MSQQIWNALKASPIVLGAFLLVASSAQATQNSSSPVTSVSATTIPNEKISEKPTDLRDRQRFQTLAPSSSSATQTGSDPEVASSTNQAALLSKSFTAVSTEPQQSTVTQHSVLPPHPSELSINLHRTDSVLAQQMPASDNSNSEVLQQIDQYQQNDSDTDVNGTDVNALDQVTNVTQLSDVRPTDWAYEALRSLVERYGCIAGYPDGTYRGNRAMSRYEFAAGLNACLQQVERLIATNTGEFVTKQDLETLQRLVDEFRAELTALGTRVDTLEGRVAFLENHQFSTTTKLKGEAIFAISDLFGGEDAAGNDYARDETVFQDRVRLTFDTSLTGKDLLRTRLQAGNFTEFGPLTGSPGRGVGITREGRFGFASDTGNDVEIDRLYYRFPVSNLAQVYLLASGVPFEDIVDVVNPGFDSGGTGALSRFGRFNPIYRMGGQGTGAGVVFGGGKLPVRLDLVYSTNEGNNPSEEAGLFDGNYSALAQVTFKPFDAFKVAATYIHSYDNSGGFRDLAGNPIGGNLRHGTGSITSQINTSFPVVGNSYGLQASFAFSPKLVLSGWAGYTNAIVLGRGTADVWNYAATLSINDFGTKGSSLGFVVGMEPKLTGSDVSVGSLLGRRRDPDTSLHIEGFYKFRLTPNVLITPGVIWLTAPGHNNANDDIVIGTIRTTFSF